MLAADERLEPLLAGRETPAAYTAAARQIDAGALAGLRPMRVSLLSTATFESVRPYLVVEAARRGLHAVPLFAPYNQIEQQLFTPTSSMYRDAVDVIVLATRLEEMAPEVVSGFLGLDEHGVRETVARVERRLTALLDAIRGRTSVPVICFNYALVGEPVAGLADAGLMRSQRGVIESLNVTVAAVCRAFSAAVVFDYHRLVMEHGIERWADVRLTFRGRIPFGAAAQRALGTRLARYLRALIRPACKCLVLDLDNTVWGGVLGEDGPSGIHLGEDHPGNVYRAFQRAVLELHARGILLAIASKNNRAEVDDVLATHPDSLLRPHHFAAIHAHWHDKASSLRAIADELALGLDALAFFDDSPVERALVRQALPQVTVIEVPPDATQYIAALHASEAFDVLIVSDEDRCRPEMYVQARARQQAQGQTRVEDFLADLALSAEVGLVDERTLPRAAQLLAKTNQFNLTTRRHSAADLQRLVTGGLAVWLRARDRFGDYGLVGLALAVPESATAWHIDTLLLSCRAIGRGLETALLADVVRRVRAAGGKSLLGEFLATPRNAPAADFYSRHSFTPVGPDGRWWQLVFETQPLPGPPPYITLHGSTD